MVNITKAILSVMNEVQGIEKSMTIGTGKNSYKGIADSDVKKIIGTAMRNNGLVILPTGIEKTVDIIRYEQTNDYGVTQKQNVFTDVVTKYLLLHESGESIEVVGYGHGIDTQDKSAGKATTYALKYALLYMFMVPTGAIDDTDKTHSNDIPTPTIEKKNQDHGIVKHKFSQKESVKIEKAKTSFNDMSSQSECEQAWDSWKRKLVENTPLYDEIKKIYATRWKALK